MQSVKDIVFKNQKSLQMRSSTSCKTFNSNFGRIWNYIAVRQTCCLLKIMFLSENPSPVFTAGLFVLTWSRFFANLSFKSSDCCHCCEIDSLTLGGGWLDGEQIEKQLHFPFQYILQEHPFGAIFFFFANFRLFWEQKRKLQVSFLVSKCQSASKQHPGWPIGLCFVVHQVIKFRES